MRSVFSSRMQELLEIIRPYVGHLGGIVEDAPPEVKKAYEEFCRLGDEGEEY